LQSFLGQSTLKVQSLTWAAAEDPAAGGTASPAAVGFWVST